MAGAIKVIFSLSFGGLLLGILYFIESVGKSQSEPAKRELSKALASFDPSNFIFLISKMLKKAFDNFFGEAYFSWKAFKRSLIGSFIFTLLLYFIVFPFHEMDWTLMRWEYLVRFVADMILNFAVLNLIPDYLLVIKTRYILNLLTNNNESKAYKSWKILLFDTIGTFAFGLLKFFLILVLLGKVFDVEPSGLQDIFYETIMLSVHEDSILQDSITQNSTLVSLDYIPGVFFYSIFFYSTFLWLYLLSGYILKKKEKFIVFHKFVNKRLIDVENKPVESIRTLFIGIALIIAAIICICSFLISL